MLILIWNAVVTTWKWRVAQQNSALWKVQHASIKLMRNCSVGWWKQNLTFPRWELLPQSWANTPLTFCSSLYDRMQLRHTRHVAWRKERSFKPFHLWLIPCKRLLPLRMTAWVIRSACDALPQHKLILHFYALDRTAIMQSGSKRRKHASFCFDCE